MGFTCILKTNIVLVGRYWDFNPLPDMPSVGSSNSAANKDMMSNICKVGAK